MSFLGNRNMKEVAHRISPANKRRRIRINGSPFCTLPTMKRH